MQCDVYCRVLSPTSSPIVNADFSENQINMNVTIRRAVAEDCERLMELITELAVYEKAPEEVTVTLEHFIHSGFMAARTLAARRALIIQRSGTIDSFP